MGYYHSQTGVLHFPLYVLSLAFVAGAWSLRGDLPALFVLLGIGVFTFLLAESFRHLTVEDEGDCLAVRFGPVPLFRKRIRYEEITAAEPGRTTVLDGWGIHYMPRRGWTYNIWGFDCVKLTVGKKVIRIGSDDVENLMNFLRAKINPPE
jgi:hypothetical protein